MTVIVKVDLPDFRRQLAEVEKRMRMKITRAALRAAGNVFARVARQKAPRLDQATKQRIPGALRRAIYVGRGRTGRDRERFFVSVRGGKRYAAKGRGDPFYWKFLEAGWIPRGPGGKLKGGNRSKKLQRSRARAAGAREVRYPFFKPAFDEAGRQALAAFNERMVKGISALRTIR